MNKTFVRHCPVCEKDSKELLYRQVFADVARVSFLKGYDVVVCRYCGFAFADNIPSQEVFDRYYERQSKYEKTSSRMSESRLEVMDNGLKFIQGFVRNKNIKVLEIGCGPGDFLRFLKENGFVDLTAVEPSQRSANYLMREFGINAIAGAISNPRLKEAYELAVLLTVLEHIVDLKAAINNISRMLRKGGLLFIRVPNACQFSDFDDAPFQQFSPEHINYFSTVSARNLLGKYGFSILGCLEVSMPESDNTLLPMINLMFRKNDKANGFTPEQDMATQTQLKKYIELSAAKEREIDRKINTLAISQEPIVVWGVGTHTLRLLESGALKKCNIVAFIDSNDHYNGGVFHDIPVHSPKELPKYPNKILISSKVFQTEISDFIKNDLKAPNELVLLY